MIKSIIVSNDFSITGATCQAAFSVWARGTPLGNRG